MLNAKCRFKFKCTCHVLFLFFVFDRYKQNYSVLVLKAYFSSILSFSSALSVTEV